MGIHHDFYGDQVIVMGDRLWLLDLDLYCQVHPALDMGNFIAHITEFSLREWGNPAALADRETALTEAAIVLWQPNLAISPQVLTQAIEGSSPSRWCATSTSAPALWRGGHRLLRSWPCVNGGWLRGWLPANGQESRTQAARLVISPIG